MVNEEYISTVEAAEILGVSRIAVFKKIKSGNLPHIRVGKNYLIKKSDLPTVFREISTADKKEINAAVNKVFREYGDVIKKLGKE